MKSPTTQAVGAALRKAGHERSKSSSSRIKGMREWTEGCQVTKYDESEVHVEWRPHSFSARQTSEEKYSKMLDTYAETLIGAGFAVETVTDSLYPRLRVTGRIDNKGA